LLRLAAVLVLNAPIYSLIIDKSKSYYNMQRRKADGQKLKPFAHGLPNAPILFEFFIISFAVSHWLP
jgi:hypothetical protein